MQLLKGKNNLFFKKFEQLFMLTNLVGDNTGRVTPVPIPNTAVKPSKADGTLGATLWESR